MVGYPCYAAYNVSKAGVIELTRSMALALAPNIRVDAICPGYVLTPIQEAEYTPQMMEKINRKIPPRHHAKPEEIAALCAFLDSDEVTFITGHCFMIDGAKVASGIARS